MSFDELPIIIVSAHTLTAAEEFITELIEEDVTVEVRPAEHASPDRVWRLRNRYYTADVRVWARETSGEGGAAGGQGAGPVCAHVMLLEEGEARAEEAARRRRAERAWLAGQEASLCVVACRAGELSAGLRAHCAGGRLAAVALRDAEEGVGAVRDAVHAHAHAWPGARRVRGPPSPREPDSGSGSLGSSWESLDGGGGGPGAAAAHAAGVEAMERFAAVLGALGPAAGAVRALRGEERLAAAEHLVAAFAAALGPDDDL